MFEVIISNTLPMGTVTIYLGENDGTQEGYYLTVDKVTKTEGLLSNVGEKIGHLQNAIGSFLVVFLLILVVFFKI